VLTTFIGLSIDHLDTPALLIDLDAFERNLTTMSQELNAAGVSWRPHAKGHKCPAITHKQIAAGAIGVTCAKIGEAEVMAAAGVRDILIANQIVGSIKARRLAALCRHADVVVAVDNITNAREISDAGLAAGTRPRVIVELNVGMERAGVLPGEAAVKVAHQIAALDGVRFAGLMGYEGHGMDIADSVRRRDTITKSVTALVDTAEAVRASGLPVEIVSASGTGTYRNAITISGITEVQAGGGIFGDSVYRDLDVAVEPALLLLSQVTSRPTSNRIIIDAGRKSVDPGERVPSIRGMAGVTALKFSAEHGTVSLDHDTATPDIGDRVLLEIGYHDQVTHLHDYLFGVRNGTIETIWPVASRGRLQ
jgi:D-serine deaminase-like pyridoxal phosphate-dependent protein